MAARSALVSRLPHMAASLFVASTCTLIFGASSAAGAQQQPPQFPSGLEPVGFGWDGSVQELCSQEGEPTPSSVIEADRIRRTWTPDLEEWAFYERGGIEHGFSLLSLPPRVGADAGRPGGSAESLTELRTGSCTGSWVALELRMPHDHSALVDGSGRHASLQDASGEPRFTYTDLFVIDGDGRELPAYLEPVEDRLRIVFDAEGATLPIVIDPLFQDAYIKSSAPDAMDLFGRAVAAFGDRIAFGAPGEASSATGVGGSAANNSAPDAGAVFVFRFVGGDWVQEAYIKASNTDAGDGFGSALALGPDILVVGAPEEASSSTIPYVGENLNDAPAAGAAYVYRYDAAALAWFQDAYLKASNAEGGDRFGASVAVSVGPAQNGDYVVVGAPEEDSSVTGDGANNAAFNAGAAYMFFSLSQGAWAEEEYLKAAQPGSEDAFGDALAVEAPADFGEPGILIVGATNEDGGSTGVDGDESDNSRPNAGAVYVFSISGTSAVQSNYLKASNTGSGDGFGASVALDGTRIAVGAPFEDSSVGGVNPLTSNDALVSAGAAYTFRFGFQGWVQDAYVKASNPGGFDRFGQRVALADGRLLVGAPGEASTATGINGDQTNNSAAASGAAYLFQTAAFNAWFQDSYIKASNTAASDFFAFDIALTDRWVAVGASGEDSSSAGVGGNPFNNQSSAAGAGYAFRLGEGPFLGYCPAAPNSTGTVGSLTGAGSGLIAQNNVVLTASSLPTFAFGYFIVGPERNFVVMPAGSAGNICVGGAIGRYVGPGQIQNSGASGSISISVDANAIPAPQGPFAVAPGQELHFQAWHRDSIAGVPGSNFTGGLTVLFR